jgi:glycerophosphodiester phosphodiesterase
VGFNLECKYPMVDECELEEMEYLNVELNHWVDNGPSPFASQLTPVLRVVYDNINGRDIIFSSFHPDICMMLAMKQVPPLWSPR